MAGDTLSLRYAAPGPVAGAFVRDRTFVRGIRGPIGSGKSTACIFSLLLGAAAQRPGTRSGVRRSRWGVIRNTYPELKTTTIKSWHQWVPESYGQWQGEGPPSHQVTLELGAGDRIEMETVFLALDRPEDVRKLLSLELTGAWVNEAREVPREILNHLQGRVGRFPPASDGGATWSGIVMDTNPPDVDHWWYALFEEQRPEGFRQHVQPSGRSPAAENLQNLPPGYYQRAMLGQSEDWIRVYIDGEYGYSRDGKPVYPEYRDSLHVASERLLPVRGLRLVVGADAGRTPAAIITQPMPNGQWRVLDELMLDNAGATTFGRRLAELLAAEPYRGLAVEPGDIEAWGDPAASNPTETEERSWLEIVAAVSGIRFRPAPSNRLTPRLEAVRVPLTRLIDGQPGLLLSPACRATRKGFNSGYRFRRMQVPGGAQYTDQPEKNDYSHVHDALQYALLGGGEYAEVTGRREARRRSMAAGAAAGGEYDPFEW